MSSTQVSDSSGIFGYLLKVDLDTQFSSACLPTLTERRAPTRTDLWRLSAPEAGIQGIPQPITQQIDAQHHDADGRPSDSMPPHVGTKL
jgi:hypothetical protein